MRSVRPLVQDRSTGSSEGMGISVSITNQLVAERAFLRALCADEYFPDHLLDKGRDILTRLCERVEAERPADLAGLYALTEAARGARDWLIGEVDTVRLRRGSGRGTVRTRGRVPPLRPYAAWLKLPAARAESVGDQPHEAGPRAGSQGQHGATRPLRVADVHVCGGGGDLYAFAAVTGAVTALEPLQPRSSRFSGLNSHLSPSSFSMNSEDSRGVSA